MKFISAVDLERRRLFTTLLLAVLSFFMFCVMLLAFAQQQAAGAIDAKSRAVLQQYTETGRKVDAVFGKLREEVVAQPCTPAFQAQLRRVSYIPDGLNTFFYAPGGMARCSTDAERFDPPIALGQPDTRSANGASSVWFDRDLGTFGLDGLTGTIVLREPFAVVVPPQGQAALGADMPSWYELELVLLGSDGRWWHRSGAASVYQAYLAAMRPDASRLAAQFHRLTCDEDGRRCVAARAHPTLFARQHEPELLMAVGAAAVLALACGSLLYAALRRYCSFDNRFRRNLSPGSILCSYQPVMDLASGRMVGCEVLARWRDVDGSVVYPDRFIPLIERLNLTLPFTRAVVARALEELAAALPEGMPMQVAFNVFPCDLANKQLPDVFRAFERHWGRFTVVAEIIESAAFAAEEAHSQIVALRKAGVRVYLDDFGSGYSNIQALAALPIDGVKLDRAFAMAPEGSMMAQMLTYAVNLLNVAGRVTVVEGIETEAKLQALRALGSAVDHVQGYHIARPLPIDDFAAFVTGAAAQDVVAPFERALERGAAPQAVVLRFA